MIIDTNQNLALSIEASLGQIIKAYPFYSKSKESKFYIAEFAPEIQEHYSLRIFGTIGISDYVQYLPDDSGSLRQEFVIIMEKGQNSDWIIGILADVCYRLLSTQKAVCRGETIGPYGPIHDSTLMTGFYATQPIFLDEEKMTFEMDDTKRPIHWLIPIYGSEFEYLKTNGWKKFERLLESNFGSLPRLDRSNLSPSLFKYSDLQT